MSDKWFLLEGFTDRGEFLRQSRIVSTLLDVSKPKPISGIAFHEADRVKVLELFGLRNDLVEVPTDRPGVFLLAVKEEAVRVPEKVYELVFSGWNGYGSKAKYKELVQNILCPVVKNKVVVRNPQTPRPTDECEPDWFHILIWSAPTHGVSQKDAPENIWGHKIYSRRGAYNYSGEGLPIESEDGNFVVAEIVGNHIYILYGINNGEDDHQYAIFENILKKAAAHFAGTSDELQKVALRWHERALAGMRDKYAEVCLGRLGAEIKAAEKTVLDTDNRVADLQAQIVKHLRAAQESRRKMQLLAVLTEEKDAYLNEYDRIGQIAGLKRMTISDDHIVFFTDFVTIVHDGVEYSIGEFKVTISLKNGFIQFYNLTNQGRGPAATVTEDQRRRELFATSYNWHHPHIRKDGVACLGNIGETIGQLIGEHRYSIVIHLLIQFLKSVNVQDGAGKGIAYWPKMEKKAEEVAIGA